MVERAWLFFSPSCLCLHPRSPVDLHQHHSPITQIPLRSRISSHLNPHATPHLADLLLPSLASSDLSFTSKVTTHSSRSRPSPPTLYLVRIYQRRSSVVLYCYPFFRSCVCCRYQCCFEVPLMSFFFAMVLIENHCTGVEVYGMLLLDC